MVDQQVEGEVPAAQASEPAPAPAPVAAKYGVDETKKVLDLVLAVAKAVSDAEKDGKISLDDLPLLLQVVPKLGAALGDISKLPSELGDLDAPEAEELVAYVVAGLTVESEKAKAIIAASLKVVVASYSLVQAIRA